MIDIQNTRAILIGVSEFQDKKHFVDAAPIKNNVLDFKTRLMDESVLGLPESQILLLNRNETHIQILDKVEEFLKQTWGDTLIFYFAGHGYKTKTGDFYLVCNNTSEKHIDITGISWEKIKELFETGGYGIQQRFYILDACHSGAATLGGDDTLDIAQGSALIAAAKANKKAYFDPSDQHTYFTAALLKILDKGVRKLEKPELSIKSIFDKMNLELKDRNFDLQIKTTDRINDVNFFLNKSFDELALVLKEADDFFENTDYKKAIAKYSEALVICTVNQNQSKAQEITQQIQKAKNYQKIIDKNRLKAQKDVGSVPPPKSYGTTTENSQNTESTFVKVSNFDKGAVEEKDPKSAFNFKNLLIPLIFLIVGIVGWQVWEAMQKPQDNDLVTFQKAKRKNTREAYSNYLKIYPKGDSVSPAKELLYALENTTTTEDTPPQKDNTKEELLWKDVAKKNTKKAYEKYLYNFPNGKYARLAKKKMQNSITKTNTSNLLPKIEMVKVEGGIFKMGSNEHSSEKPIHTVKLSNFQIGKYEVTQKLWKAVMGTNPSKFKGDNLPVENVSWNDVQGFLKKLNQKTGKNYRLPTEAEWEFAARGGNKSKNYTYSGNNTLERVAWYSSNSGNKTHNVGGKSPNELEIYDMSGNVWEWCNDWYGTYPSANQTNPKGASSGEGRVLRGGSWLDISPSCQVFYHSSNTPSVHAPSYGFRIASSLP